MSYEFKMLDEKQLQEEFAKAPTSERGKWQKLCEQVKTSGQGGKVTGLSKGQVYNLIEAAENAGIFAKGTDTTTAVILSATPFTTA